MCCTICPRQTSNGFKSEERRALHIHWFQKTFDVGVYRTFSSVVIILNKSDDLKLLQQPVCKHCYIVIIMNIFVCKMIIDLFLQPFLLLPFSFNCCILALPSKTNSIACDADDPKILKPLFVETSLYRLFRTFSHFSEFWRSVVTCRTVSWYRNKKLKQKNLSGEKPT